MAIKAAIKAYKLGTASIYTEPKGKETLIRHQLYKVVEVEIEIRIREPGIDESKAALLLLIPQTNPRPPTPLPMMMLRTTLTQRHLTAWISRPPPSLKYTLELMTQASHIAVSRHTGSRPGMLSSDSKSRMCGPDLTTPPQAQVTRYKKDEDAMEITRVERQVVTRV